MNWTRDKPTEPGYYWMIDRGEVEIFQVYRGLGGHLIVEAMGTEEFCCRLADVTETWWMGPIEVPTPPTTQEDKP